MSTNEQTPIERAAEACLAYSSEIYGDSGWKWDELKPETRGIWLGYARAGFESIDDEWLARMLYRRDTPDDADFWDNGLPKNFKRIWLLEAQAVKAALLAEGDDE